MNAVRTPARLGALAAVAALTLSACASADEPGEITVTDPWVKTAESGMTAAFGELTNGTDETVVLVAAASAVSTEIQLHETLSDESGGMSMSEKEGGFAIAPGETLTLEPGGNHLMLMGVTEPIEAGDIVDVTLTFEDGSTVDVTADAKDYMGAQESYAPGAEMEMGS
ncbi:copper chaperone PCu(A)C [Demequina sp. NBRC 110051]|uniref:copper chaperone PCu(A)C n=1 Tax=Demequina sp. NBRC 110051 TaxID=1570340 RepID=UPI000A036710|nr:copper chaperone PCu(A)C [Demequina sp. NBRC 110051]